MPDQKTPHAVAFVAGHYNRYSIAVLTGIVETDERLHAVALHFLDHNRAKPKTARKNLALTAHVLELARQYQKIVIAFSFATANVIEMAATIATLREHLLQNHVDNVLLVAGGSHPSGDPIGTLQIGIDVVVVGEGEVTFPTFLDRFFTAHRFTDVPGLSFFDEHGQYRYTGAPAPVDLSAFPPFAFRHGRYCPMEISRGCPWGCLYCQTPFLMGRQMRHRSFDSIMTYAERGKRVGLNVMRFIAPSAFAYGSPDGRTVNLAALENMLRAVSAIYGKQQTFLGSFPSEVRPDQVSLESLQLVRAYCSNPNFVIGAQSGSDRLLETLHRGHGVAEVVRATELTVSAGFVPHLDFIFGLPGETPQDREITLALITRLTAMGARIHSHAFMPLVGTPFAQCAPGIVNQDIRQLITSLRGQQLEHGFWREQEQLAQATVAFLASQQKERLEDNDRKGDK